MYTFKRDYKLTLLNIYCESMSIILLQMYFKRYHAGLITSFTLSVLFIVCPRLLFLLVYCLSICGLWFIM